MTGPHPQNPVYDQEPVYEAEAEPDDRRPLDDEGDVRAVADYLADMIGQLEDIARRSRLDLLVYLLSMAKSEAQANAGPAAPLGALGKPR